MDIQTTFYKVLINILSTFEFAICKEWNYGKILLLIIPAYSNISPYKSVFNFCRCVKAIYSSIQIINGG